MTTEVAVMNRRALVLAADSAGTVTSWVHGKQETRYFKGENKVFQLSLHHPIGLMTYNNAHLMHVPWEVVIKEFRAQLGTESFINVRTYAERLFDFLASNELIFPKEQRETDFRSKVGQQMLRLAIEIFNDAQASAVQDHEERRSRFAGRFSQAKETVLSREIHKAFTVGDVQRAISDFGHECGDACEQLFKGTDLQSVLVGLEQDLFELAVNLVFRDPADVSSTTGIVVAGFGENDIFPRLHEFEVQGFVRESLLYDEKREIVVTSTTPGAIHSFATTSMVETFTDGLNNEACVQALSAFDESVAKLLSGVETEHGVAIADKPYRIDAARKQFLGAMLGETMRVHRQPLVNVVAMLAIDEMANLAETLVSLESLKEKVTRPTESVGGAVDVAAITKAEGLVWIKRKHHFDITTNPRYAAKLARVGG